MTDATSTYSDLDMVVWSGTGNTLHVAERLAEHARSTGVATRITTTPDTVEPQPVRRRLLGLLAPTHGFTAPWPLLKAALKQPGVRGTDVFVLVTRGGTKVGGRLMSGFEGTAAYLPAAILALRGARIRGVGAIDMPLNWTVILPSFDQEGVAKIVARGDAEVDEFSGPLLKGERVIGGLIQVLLGILILPLSLGYMLIARLMLGKTFFADTRCISCGTCEKNCPQGAVRLRGTARRPYWTYRCQNCMRCMSNCPTDAIQGGQAWLVLYIWLAGLPLGAVAASALLDAIGVTGAFTTGFAGLLADYSWIVISVWLAYAALWLGLLVPGLREVLSRATLTRGYRRYRGPKTRA